jgi:hypothetical protein
MSLKVFFQLQKKAKNLFAKEEREKRGERNKK